MQSFHFVFSSMKVFAVYTIEFTMKYPLFGYFLCPSGKLGTDFLLKKPFFLPMKHTLSNKNTSIKRTVLLTLS